MTPFNRREFVGLAAASLVAAQNKKAIPVGLQLFAVHDDLKRDWKGTLATVSQMGFEVVEFSATPYFAWTPADAREVRKVLNDLHLRCLSTHNEAASLTSDGLSHAIEINRLIGSESIVLARGPNMRAGGGGLVSTTLDDWKRFADQLDEAGDRLKAQHMHVGFHNHAIEFQAMEGTRPIDLLAARKNITFHLNIGLCLQGNGNPAEFLEQVSGRVHAVLCTDFPPDAAKHPAMMGKGVAKWKDIFKAAEAKGGVRFYLIQQEGSEYSPLDAVRQDLQYFRELHV